FFAGWGPVLSEQVPRRVQANEPFGCGRPDIEIAVSDQGEHLLVEENRRNSLAGDFSSVPPQEAIVGADPQLAVFPGQQTVNLFAGRRLVRREDVPLAHVEEAFVLCAQPDFAVAGFSDSGDGVVWFGEALRAEPDRPTQARCTRVGLRRRRAFRGRHFGGSREHFKFSVMVSESAQGQGGQQDAGVFSPAYRSDSELGFLALQLKLSIPVAQNL